MRVLPSVLSLTGCTLLVASASQQQQGGRNKVLHRTLSSKGGADEVHAHAAAKRAHRRTQLNDWGSVVDDAFKGFKAGPDMLKLIGNANHGLLNDELLSALTDQVTEQDADFAFQHFPMLKGMPAYKDFIAKGSTDPAEKMGVQLTSLQDLVFNMMETTKVVVDHENGGAASLGEELLKAANPELLKDFDLMSSTGDVNAFSRIAQSFSDKFLGGADISTFYDNSWVDERKKDFLGDANLLRLMDDSMIESILKNPGMKMLNPSVGDSSDKFFESMAGFLPEF